MSKSRYVAANKATEYKDLLKRASKLKANLTGLLQEKKDVDSKIAYQQRQLDNVEAGLSKFQEHLENVIITDHVKVRFMQRVLGFDFRAIEDQIITPEIRKQILTLRNAKIPVEYNGQEYILMVEFNVVKTIIPKEDLREEEVKHNGTKNKD